MFYVFFPSFSYRSKVIIKDISIVKGIEIVSPLSKEISVGALDSEDFIEIKDLIPFHVFQMLFKFFSKYLA